MSKPEGAGTIGLGIAPIVAHKVKRREVVFCIVEPLLNMMPKLIYLYQ